MLLKKYFWIIHLILVTILVWAVIDLTMTLVSSRLEIQTGGTSGALASSRRESVSVPPISAYDSIIQDNIFNPGVRIARRSAAAAAAKQAASTTGREKASAAEKETPPPTTLNVILRGTAILEPEQDSLAVIYDKGTQDQKIYRVGDSLYDAKVEKIFTDRVILERGGALETLSIIREDLEETANKRTTRSLKPGSSMVERKDAQNYVLDREQVSDMVTNINQFMTQLRVRPHFSDGKPIGYLVSDIKQGSLIDQIGLKNGDIIKSVNGLPITQPDQAFAAYQQLMDESQVTLELQRGRGTQVITYELK